MKRALAVAALAALSLTGCQLQPLYAGGSSGTVATTLSSVSVSPIEGQVGWLVYNKLKDRLGASGTSETRYRLNVELDDDIASRWVPRIVDFVRAVADAVSQAA